MAFEEIVNYVLVVYGRAVSPCFCLGCMIKYLVNDDVGWVNFFVPFLTWVGYGYLGTLLVYVGYFCFFGACPQIVFFLILLVLFCGVLLLSGFLFLVETGPTGHGSASSCPLFFSH